MREWLREIDVDLEIYEEEFDKLGYKPKFMRRTETGFLKHVFDVVPSVLVRRLVVEEVVFSSFLFRPKLRSELSR